MLNRKTGQIIEGRGSLKCCYRPVVHESLIISMLYGEFAFILSEATKAAEANRTANIVADSSFSERGIE